TSRKSHSYAALFPDGDTERFRRSAFPSSPSRIFPRSTVRVQTVLLHLLRAVERFFSSRSAGFILGLGIMLAVATAVADVSTDPALSFTVFYMVPISIVAWFGETRRALGLAVLCVCAWMLTEERSAGHSFGILLWNAFFRLVIFALGVL